MVIIVGLVLVVGGLVGCFVPVLPGPSLSFAGLVLLGIMSGFANPLTVRVLIVLGGVMVVVTAADYVLPIVGVRRFGASKWGVWGSLLGCVAGAISYSPLGMIIGALVGAVAGEVAGGKELEGAMRAGVGVLVGNVLSLVMKLVAWAVTAYYFVAGAVEMLKSP